ncbi:MAG TPA: universal stress protein [Candidatus Acidoferrum sp.]
MSTQVTQPATAVMPEVRADKKLSLNKIMVLTDFSGVSDLALEYALALARRYNSWIYLTHILSTDVYQLTDPPLAEMTYKKMRQAAEQGMADIVISGKLRGVPHETLLHEGPLWPTVERLIREHEIDLAVTGTHGLGQVKKIIIGSVAEEVFRQATCPVLTVGPRTEAQVPPEVSLKNILFATDFGPGAEQAAKYAFSLAQEHNARLTMLHAVEEARAHTEEEVERVRKVNIQKMKQFVPPESDNWCNVSFRVTFGAPVEEILTEAWETKADMIVMGAKTRKTVAGHAPQATAYNVVAKAMSPVLTVRG